jgi:hypothetical protein
MPEKLTWIFIKYSLKKKSSLSLHIMKKNEKHYTHPFLQPPIPHHQRKNSLGKKKPPNLPTLKNNETYVSHATQETTLKNSPHPPQKNSPFPIHPKNLL